VLEVLSLIRSVKNTSAFVNGIPSEVLSLIPDHLSNEDADIVALTHVCRSWREIFISRSSLWTYLDCLNVDKTSAYIKRSNSSPLDIRLEKSNNRSYDERALYRVVPYVDRVGSLTVYGSVDVIPDLRRRFHYRSPLLRELKLDLTIGRRRAPAFPIDIFNGDLSSLRKLTLAGFVTSVPWRNLVNLTTFKLSRIPGTAGPPFVTELLDFLESAPLLSNIELNSVPASSNGPPGRVVPIPHLKRLILSSSYAHSTLLKHLSIPTGASLVLDFSFYGADPPIFDCLPPNFSELGNLSRITSVNLLLGPGAKYVRFDGPSGKLYLFGTWPDGDDSPRVTQCQTFQFLGGLDLPKVRRLAVTMCTLPPEDTIDKSSIFQILLSMNDLRILTLIKCNNLSFIRTLNPRKTDSGTVVCPNLEELILYIKKLDWFYTSELEEMALARAERYAKRSSITLVSLGEMQPKEEVLALRLYFPRVEYKVDNRSPEWDALPGEEDVSDDGSDV